MAGTLLVLPLRAAIRINWPRWSWALALLVIGSTVLAGPYMILKGSPGTRPAIARVLGLAPAADPLGLERERPLDPSQTATQTYLESTLRVAEVVLGSVTPTLLPFAAIGLFVCRPWRERPRGWVLFAGIAVVSVLGLVRLYATGGYCSVRHALIPGLFLTLLAAKGWDWVIDRISIPGRWFSSDVSTFRPGPAVWFATVGVVAILPGLRDLGPARPGPFWLYRSAADHLVDLAEPSERVLDLTDWSLFFSGRPGYRFADVFSAPADQATRWIVLTTPHVDGDRSFSPILRELIGDRKPIVSIPARPDPRQLQLRIYERTPQPSATTPRIVNAQR
jgi:hypothetical protein